MLTAIWNRKMCKKKIAKKNRKKKSAKKCSFRAFVKGAKGKGKGKKGKKGDNMPARPVTALTICYHCGEDALLFSNISGDSVDLL
jgi:hypothetical protein